MNQSTIMISRTSCVSVHRDPRGDAAGSHMSQSKGLQLLEGNISGDPMPTTPRRQVGPTFLSHILTRTPRLCLDSGADRWTPLCSHTQETARQDYSGWAHMSGAQQFTFSNRENVFNCKVKSPLQPHCVFCKLQDFSILWFVMKCYFKKLNLHMARLKLNLHSCKMTTCM